MKRLLITVAVVLNLVLADAVAKELARGLLGPSAEGGPRVVKVVPGLFDLAYVENRGCAWGLLQGRVWPLAAFGAAALAFLVWRRKEVFAPGRLAAAAEPLLYAGIVGNLVDRVFRGYVIDMLDFHWGPHHFPCFNIADSLICVAVGLLVVSSLAAPRQSPAD
ncbi:MAG: signal peptidase II [Kiritimatiellae bacterium]|nr:signal peptidase II [Kiritimatiellia bacterium]